MNIYFQELKSYRKSTVIWIFSLSLLTIVFLLMYPAFTKDVIASKKILANLPAAIREGLGISLNNFFTIYGFYAYIYIYVVLAGAIQACNLGVSIISKEESGKTADFLLTKPVSRFAVISNKLFAAFSLLLITNVIYVSISYIAAKIITNGDLSFRTFFLISATLFLVQLAFLALGLLFSVTLPRIKSVITISLPTVFTFFIIGTLGAILGNENVRYITPFKFYDSNYIISNGSFEIKFIAIESIFVVVAVIASYIIFIQKDIRAAS